MLPNEFPNHLIADHHFYIFLLIFEICNNTIYWITYTLNLISSSSHVPSCSPAPAATPGRPLLPSPCCHRQRLWAVTTSSPSPCPPPPPPNLRATLPQPSGRCFTATGPAPSSAQSACTPSPQATASGSPSRHHGPHITTAPLRVCAPPVAPRTAMRRPRPAWLEKKMSFNISLFWHSTFYDYDVNIYIMQFQYLYQMLNMFNKMLKYFFV